MSLLEVFVALAIFIAALAVISQQVSIGTRAALSAQLQTEATLRAETCMAEAVAGVIPLQNGSQNFEDDEAWSWNLEVGTGPQTNTLKLVVIVKRTNPGDRVVAQRSLTRIIRDPQIYLDAAGTSSNTSPLDLLQ